MIKRSEISFYPEIIQKVVNRISPLFPNETKIAYSFNKTLDKMVTEIESELDCKSSLSNDYLPLLKLDILIGVKPVDKPVEFILLEVKYENCLTLAHYSQLTGYLQVAKKIKYGILFLVSKGEKTNILSNDFSDILKTGCLPMCWTMNTGERIYEFKTGIYSFIPGGIIEHENIDLLGGIRNFEDLRDLIIG